jgi:hypothetical protein
MSCSSRICNPNKFLSTTRQKARASEHNNLSRTHANIISRLDAQLEFVQLPVTLIGARVVTQNVLLREIGGDLIERDVKLIGCLGKIDGAAVCPVNCSMRRSAASARRFAPSYNPVWTT